MGPCFLCGQHSAGPDWQVRLAPCGVSNPPRTSERLIKRGSLQREHWLHIRGPSVMTVLVRKLGTLSRGRTAQAQRCRLPASPQLLPFISFLLPLAANKRPPVPGGRGDTVTQDVPSILDISSMV